MGVIYMMKDYEIASSYCMKKITTVAKKIGLEKQDLILYGDYKAKVKDISRNKSNSSLILVTAISPTPFGEGKTTVSIGLNDALRKLKKNSLAVLREPSMGPVFGMKGGACGGGYSQIVPMQDINLHFNGDFHAITSVNNLICAAIDNHIYFGNELDFQEVLFHRCLDVNDRSLRDVVAGNQHTSFSITAASEVMAIFCLAIDIKDLRRRLSKIVVGKNSKGDYIYVSDLHLEGSLLALLKDSVHPNLVQSLEGNPVLVHGGPFANIAHGCNSIIATKLGLQLADYVVTEAGFGADLGAEKFFDIKCRTANLKPKCCVLVATIKALKYHGGVDKDFILQENDEALKIGLGNLGRHIENLQSYGIPIVVALNQYDSDTKKEIQVVKEYCSKKGVSCVSTTSFLKGGRGAIRLAEEVISLCSKNSHFHILYDLDLSIEDKIWKIASQIYHADAIEYSDLAKEKILELSQKNLSNLPICVAKTQYSFSDDAKKVGAPEHFTITVRDVQLYHGASFITILLGNIMTMPGLSRKPNYLKIDVQDDCIVGLN